MKKIKILGLVLFFIPFYTHALSSGVHITKDGNVVISQAKIMQLAGNSFYARLYWDEAYVRFLIKTGNNTKFLRGTGEATTLSEVSMGDVVDLVGKLESGGDSLIVVASSIKNSSVQKQGEILSGKVTSVDLPNRLFYLNTKNNGIVTIKTTFETVFTKGSRTLDLEHVKVGDTITKTAGDYDIPTKTLLARTVLTYVDPNYYKAKNFQGTLTELSSTSLPGSIKIKIDGLIYTVNLTDKTLVWNKTKSSVVLNRFVTGDTIRAYGTIREVDEPIIDAEIIRNINL